MIQGEGMSTAASVKGAMFSTTTAAACGGAAVAHCC